MSVINNAVNNCSERTNITVHQPNHGFSVGDAINISSEGWALSDASSRNTLCCGVVDSVSNIDNFSVVLKGTCKVSNHGFGAGTFLYLSDSTPGTLTNSLPSKTNSWVQSVAKVLDEKTLILSPEIVSSAFVLENLGLFVESPITKRYLIDYNVIREYEILSVVTELSEGTVSGSLFLDTPSNLIAEYSAKELSSNKSTHNFTNPVLVSVGQSLYLSLSNISVPCEGLAMSVVIRYGIG